MELVDKHIIITGAARGLGLAMAGELAAAGARIGMIDLDAALLAAAADSLPGSGHATAVADVADEAEVEAAFDSLEQAIGPVDGLINNAGITRDGLLVKAREGKVVDTMSLADWQKVIEVNLTGVFLCGREGAARMTGRGTPGVIINISSISKAGNFGQSNYAAAKAGVAAVTVTWARELARHGIRVASISPGFIATEMVSAMPDKAVQRITANVPLARLGEPSEIAATTRFIFENDYVSGRDFAVDGALRL